MHDVAIDEVNEAERVEAWRLQSLIDAGYPVEFAVILAVRQDIDLHRAVELVRRGCRPAVAVRILA